MNIVLKSEYVGQKQGTVVDVSDTLAQELISKDIGMEVVSQKHEVKQDKTVEQKDFSIAEMTQKMAIAYADHGNLAEVKAILGQGESAAVGAELVFKPILAQEAITAMKAESILWNKCESLKVSGMGQNGIILPQINETTRTVAAGLFGGVKVYNVAEGSAITPSTLATTQKSIGLGKLAGLIYVTRELLEDSEYMEKMVINKLYQALAWYADAEIVRGSLGAVTTAIVGATSTVAVTAAGANPTAAEIAAMYQAMLPESAGKAEWYVSNAQKTALASLNSGFAGTSGSGYSNVRPIFQPSFVEGMNDRLLNRPVNVFTGAETASKASAFMFLDPSKYAVVTRNDVSIDISNAPQFLTDQIAVRMILRFGGAPMYASKITLEDGTIVGPAVTRNNV